MSSEGDRSFKDFRAQACRFLDLRQILRQEYPLVRSFLEGH